MARRFVTASASCAASLFPLLLSATLGAQSHTVSPPGFASQPGDFQSTDPFFDAAARYQQVHGDVATPATVSAISLRQAQWPVRSMPARTLDAELWIGAGDEAAMTSTFASNWLGSPAIAMQRRSVNLPDWSQAPASSPAPWSVTFPFDQPTTVGTNGDLLWELRIHSTTHAGFYWADAYQAQGIALGRGGPVGTACTASMFPFPVTFQVELQARRATREFAIQAVSVNYPPNEAGAFFIGVQDSSLAIPGLCAPLRVTPLFGIPATVSGRGVLPFTIATWPFDPAAVGFGLRLQAAAMDPGRPGLPVVLSQAWVGSLPDLPPAGHPVRRLIASSATATSGRLDVIPAALITRFTH